MCGIVGFINTTNGYIQGVNGVIPDMLAVGTIRGSDSTGLMKVMGNKVSWMKDAVPGWEFVQQVKVDQFIAGMGSASFVVGHNRWGTRGEASAKNAHPFEHKHICLVHNGTVARVDDLDKKGADVDSEMIAMSLASQGVQETTNHLWGAYSLVWYDSDKHTLNFLRNKDRPMWFLTTQQKATFFCSEPQMGQWCAERRGFKVLTAESSEVDKLYSFTDGNGVPEVVEMAPIRKVWVPKTYPQAPDLFTEEERKALKLIARRYKVGDEFRFSLNDFDAEQKQGRFVRVFGESPWNNEVTCVGNYSGIVEELYTVKTLLSGEITSVAVSKKLKKVVLGLKKITITGASDPFFVPGVSNPQHANPPKSNILSGHSCGLCSHVFTRNDGDIPYLIRDGNVKQLVCITCYMDRPGVNGDFTEQERLSWH